jgi:hypothetical protein
MDVISPQYVTPVDVCSNVVLSSDGLCKRCTTFLETEVEGHYSGTTVTRGTWVHDVQSTKVCAKTGCKLCSLFLLRSELDAEDSTAKVVHGETCKYTLIPISAESYQLRLAAQGSPELATGPARTIQLDIDRIACKIVLC